MIEKHELIQWVFEEVRGLMWPPDPKLPLMKDVEEFVDEFIMKYVNRDRNDTGCPGGRINRDYDNPDTDLMWGMDNVK